MHAKAAGLALDRPLAAVKANTNFAQNTRRSGLPTIQGVIVLFDASNGCPLALLDSIEITLQRTGAATALAARHLARADARAATIGDLHHALDGGRIRREDVHAELREVAAAAVVYARALGAGIGTSVDLAG